LHVSGKKYSDVVLVRKPESSATRKDLSICGNIILTLDLEEAKGQKGVNSTNTYGFT
jgi:hypothetical protein